MRGKNSNLDKNSLQETLAMWAHTVYPFDFPPTTAESFASWYFLDQLAGWHFLREKLTGLDVMTHKFSASPW
jgi:hypothetical protein